ncbi:unnamed protein product [Cuscuta epithymum]|uniref:Uncharacterized protein n=1 Tax=Cuscuta epithymum TaxID=186058 RepID=A0AAV0EHM4_9ASTE|nr:unnamed protein product [Cuscuta epithymum]
MSRQNLVQVTEELPADESRRERRQLGGGISRASENPGKLAGDRDFVLLIDVVNGGVGAEAEEQPLHDVAHAAAAPSKHDDRIFRHKKRAIAVVGAGIARAFARGGAGLTLRPRRRVRFLHG